ncbi:hypothetical protein BK816_05985 [Boudabousia tangfeifanii]|uniref:Uncharacterized protein n=1 Tax=Boudabousia tangfeifanii TaxID=1912795 RepID=A0A1D9MKQ7_9ACTO|nr:hypothetical protein [Boudabousia tangfeifanii]AOZ72897.1 hypothetical protein BK816_05985 [Boudabousia tangfeifanii]
MIRWGKAKAQEAKSHTQLPEQLAQLVPTKQVQAVEPTTGDQWLVVNEAGLHLLGPKLEESVPWVMIEHLRFTGKNRQLTISWSDPQAPVVQLQLRTVDPEQLMLSAKEHLDNSFVITRTKELDNGQILRGAVRRDSAGELFVVIRQTSKRKSATVAQVDEFEAELLEALGETPKKD